MPSLASERIRFFAWEEPPLLMVHDGAPQGVAVDYLDALARRGGFEYTIEVLPVPRLLMMLQREAAATICITRLAAREPLFDWVGEVYHDRFRFISLSHNPRVDTLDEARRLRSVGVRGGTSLHRVLLDAGFENIETVTSEEQNVRKLVAGRIDAWFSNTFTADARILSTGFAPTQFAKGAPVVENPLWMAASKHLPPAQLALVQHGFNEMRADGTHERIFSRLAP